MSKLSPKDAGYAPRVDNSGFQDITAQDLAAALGTIRGDSGPSLVAHAKYAHDVQSLRKLLAKLAGVALQWQLPLEQQRALVELVCRDTLGPTVCCLCNGRAFVMLVNSAILCKSCGGTGIRIPSQKRMAADLGISVAEWKGRYAALHQRLSDLLNDWDKQARKAIVTNLLTL